MKRGFTLTEMLIALALTAVAIAIIAEGVRHTLDFQRQLQSVREDRETQTATLEVIRTRLENLVPADRPGEAEGETGVFFEGQIRRMIFLSADPGYPSSAGVYEYTLELAGGVEADENESAPTQLVLSRRPLTCLEDFAGRPDGNVQSWTLPLSNPLVFGYAGPGGAPAASWPDTAQYPSLVTLSAEGNGAASLIVRLPRVEPEAEDNQTGQETAQ